MKYISLASFLLTSFVSFGQEAEKISQPLQVSGYLDIYYVHDFNNPKNNTRPGFVYSYNRANEVALNLAFVKVAYAKDNVRANLALMAGTYSNTNLASEPGVLKNLLEANAGVKISRKKNLWVDAGIFGSHIGFESAIGKDCWNLTRSILADNTPYYEAGAKVSYTSSNEKWFFSGMILNGWQKIERIAGSTTPSFGTQVTYKKSSKILINSSTFIGTHSPDSARLMRYFHNLYGIFQVTEKFGITAGFDSGIQKKTPDSGRFNSWYSPVLIVRMAFRNKFVIACRGEYYSDKSGVIISTTTPNGFRTTGISANLDYKIADNALWRIEARTLNSKDAVFIKNEEKVHANTFLSTSLSVSF